MSENQTEANFSVSDYFKKAVTLPTDDVVVYLDGAKAWEHAKLSDRQRDIVRQQGVLTQRIEAQKASNKARSITDTGDTALASKMEELFDEADRLAEQKAELAEQLRASGVTMSMRAMYPVEVRLAMREARRKANTEGMNDDEKTMEIGRCTAIEFMSIAVQQMTYPDGKVFEGPFSTNDFDTMEKYLDDSEWAKLVEMSNKLNTRAAIRDAQEDAGFPDRRIEPQGE